MNSGTSNSGFLRTEAWYAIRTRSNQERAVTAFLSCKGFQPYLPTYKLERRWSDRTVISQFPFFPGYVFCQFALHRRAAILTAPGVVSIIGFGSEPTPIPNEQIDSVRRVLEMRTQSETCPFMKEGQRIQVIDGPLRGAEGILLEKKAAWKLVVSIDILQRSIAIEVDHASVKRL